MNKTKTQIIALIGILILAFISTYHTSKAEFRDVPPAYIYAESINYVQEIGIVNGYPDGSFQPEQNINRAEFLKIIIEASFDQESIQTCIGMSSKPGWTYMYLKDVPINSWFAKYVCLAMNENIIEGYNDDTFKPEQNISFTEAAKIISNSFAMKDELIDETPWYKPFVKYLEKNSAIPITIYSFNKKLTRGEMAEIIYRIHEGVMDKESKTYDELAEIQATSIKAPPMEPPVEPIIEPPFTETELIDEEQEETTASTSLKIQKPEKLYSEDSFWNTKLSDKEIYDVKSEDMMRLMSYEARNNHGFVFGKDEWTMPVYYADKNTSKFDVPLLADWTLMPNMALKNVPIPEGAQADPGSKDIEKENPTQAEIDNAELGDAHMIIIDTSTTPWTEYNFWGARMIDNEDKGLHWVANWGTKSSIEDNGIFACGLSTRASGSPLLAGLIWPEELLEGQINHKLAMSFSFNHVDGPIPPFTASDGWASPTEAQKQYTNLKGSQEEAYPLPEGAVVQLDPSINLDEILVTDPETGTMRNLKVHEKVIAKAMQEYGMVNVDNGGAVALYAVHSQSYDQDPYEQYFGNTVSPLLPPELVEHSKVIKMGPLLKKPETRLTEMAWGNYSCSEEDCQKVCESGEECVWSSQVCEKP